MLDLRRLIFGMVIDLLRSRVALEAEVLVLRQQINVLRRTRSMKLSETLTGVIFRGLVIAAKVWTLKNPPDVRSPVPRQHP
jgi:hypothetical protein